MRTLVVEDDLTGRIFLQEVLSTHGPVHVVDNGCAALEIFEAMRKQGLPFDLVCLDILMPHMDGREVLRAMREMEKGMGILSSKGAKVVMTTSLNELGAVKDSYYEFADGYLVKPVRSKELFNLLRAWEMIPAI